jgi:hypothetical protein
MTANRRLSTRSLWAIVATVMGTGVLATLVVANAINHAGWSPWLVVVGWGALVALATVLFKLRGSTALGSGSVGPMGGRGTHTGDGMHGGG